MDLLNEGSTTTVTCPRCGGEWTHHERVEIFARRAEDGPGVAIAVDLVPRSDGASPGAAFRPFAGVDPTQTFAELKAPEEFLGRRGDVRVRFRCEDCAEPFWIALVQHKGQSLVTIADTPRFP